MSCILHQRSTPLYFLREDDVVCLFVCFVCVSVGRICCVEGSGARQRGNSFEGAQEVREYRKDLKSSSASSSN